MSTSDSCGRGMSSIAGDIQTLLSKVTPETHQLLTLRETRVDIPGKVLRSILFTIVARLERINRMRLRAAQLSRGVFSSPPFTC